MILHKHAIWVGTTRVENNFVVDVQLLIRTKFLYSNRLRIWLWRYTYCKCSHTTHTTIFFHQGQSERIIDQLISVIICVGFYLALGFCGVQVTKVRTGIVWDDLDVGMRFSQGAVFSSVQDQCVVWWSFAVFCHWNSLVQETSKTKESADEQNDHVVHSDLFACFVSAIL